ncbi:hypothetical protein C8R44DRAFT_611632, partial [Mycena epipterygia]
PRNPDEIRKWLVDSRKAAGSIYASLEQSQKVYIKGMEENPLAMWAALERVHRQKKPGARFTAYNSLFNITKLPDESLTKLIGRVDDAVSLIKELRPPAHTLDDMDGELASMAMIRALPEEFKAFRSSLFLLPQLDKQTVTEAFILEESDREEQARKDAELAAALAAAALNTTVAAVTSPSPAEEFCEWCVRKGHSTKECRSMARIRTEQSEKRRAGKTNQAKTAQAVEESAATVTEFAGNASLTSDPTSPFLSKLVLTGTQIQVPLRI